MLPLDWILRGVPLADRHGHEVRGGPHDGPDTADAGTQGQGPRQWHHRNTQGIVVHQRDEDVRHCRCERERLQECRTDSGHPEHDEASCGQTSVQRHLSKDIGEHVTELSDQAHLPERLDEDKQSGEEEQGIPLHGIQELPEIVVVVDYTAAHGSHHREPSGLLLVDRGQEQRKHDAPQDDPYIQQLSLIQNRIVFGERFQVYNFISLHKMLYSEPHHRRSNGQQEDHQWGVVHQEVPETDLQLVSDHYIGRVPDQGGRAPDGSEQRLGEIQWYRVDVQLLAEVDGHGADQHDASDVVQERRQYPSQDR
mmetsp:Transcript_41815/g.110235  ORF Transcript_41815/g.110235 Transcript_41815/m.110235 type:complete len:309 (-) Transcript_41815:1456-2382(-)